MRTRHEKAQAYLNSLANNCPELPFEPTLLPELFASTADNSMSSTTHIASLVERSQGLATRILRLANSAYYGMHTSVSSLSHAIRILGLNEVRGIILQLGVSSAIRKLKFPAHFPFEALWEHQLLAANFARSIAQAAPGSVFTAEESVSPDDLYAAGLLHDIGKTLIAANCPDDWRAIADLAECERVPFYQAEEDYWGIDHSIAGARIFTFWGLPPRLTELVGWHHAPHRGNPEYKTATYILAAANLLSHYPLSTLISAPEKDGEDNKKETEALKLVLPEDVRAYMPAGVDEKLLQEKITACCDMERVRSRARASLEG